MKPLYEHDSNCCTFVRVGKDEHNKTCDIYVCKNAIIYRYSNEPNDNRSVNMNIVRMFSSEYQDILNDIELMNAYKTIQ